MQASLPQNYSNLDTQILHRGPHQASGACVWATYACSICPELLEGEDQSAEQSFHRISVGIRLSELIYVSCLAACRRVTAWERSLRSPLTPNVSLPGLPKQTVCAKFSFIDRDLN